MYTPFFFLKTIKCFLWEIAHSGSSLILAYEDFIYCCKEYSDACF